MNPSKVKKDSDQILEKTLSIAAEDALTQINNRQYITDLRQSGITYICKIGLAFSGKRLKINHEIEGVNPKNNPTLQ